MHAISSAIYKSKSNKKGFTLIEIIVVLVILAILIAVLTPSLIGYIDKARERTTVIEARSALTALQTLAAEQYGSSANEADAKKAAASLNADAETLGELKKGSITDSTVENGKVTKFTYTNASYTVTYDTAKGGFGDVTKKK